MASNSNLHWNGAETGDSKPSSSIELDAERLRQLAMSGMQGVMGSSNPLSGAGLPGALELALLQQQQKNQLSAAAANLGFPSRVGDDRLAAAAAAMANNSDLSLALAASQENALTSLFPAPSQSSPVERAHMHPTTPKSRILGLAMGPTMTSPYAAHMQMAQRAFQMQSQGQNDQMEMLTGQNMVASLRNVYLGQNQDALMNQQRQLLLLGAKPEDVSLPVPSVSSSLSTLSNIELLHLLEQKQKQEAQASVLAAAVAKPAPAPAVPPAVTPSQSTALTTRKESSFPLKLHSILANPEFQEYITWLPNGRSWRILKPAAFERVVIPLVFRHAKYASFMRQVNGWGFKRITGGPASGAAHNSYYHQYFIREYPQLCLQMKRVGKPPSKSASSDPNGDAGGMDDDQCEDTSIATESEE